MFSTIMKSLIVSLRLGFAFPSEGSENLFGDAVAHRYHGSEPLW